MARPLAFLLLLLPGIAAMAQEPMGPGKSQQVWTSVTVNGGLPSFMDNMFGRSTHKRIRLSGEFGYRSGEGFLQGRQFFTDLGVRYKVNNNLLVGFEHRYAYRLDARNRNRTGIQLIYRVKLDRLELSYRFNYQHNYREFGKKREIFRNRLAVEYDIPGFKLDPSASVEFFTWAGHRGWNHVGVRYKLGTEYRIDRKQRITVDLVHDRDIGNGRPMHHWITSLGYVMDLRKF